MAPVPAGTPEERSSCRLRAVELGHRLAYESTARPPPRPQFESAMIRLAVATLLAATIP